MKNIKKIYKLICFIMIFSLMLSIVKPVFAEEEDEFFYEPSFDLDITNVVEPVIGEVPNYTNKMNYYSEVGNNIEDFDLVYWFEFDDEYENVLENMHNIYDFYGMYDYFDYASRYSYNNNVDFWEDDGPSISKLRKFDINKTYMAVFIGTYYDVKESTIKKSTYYYGNSHISALVNDSESNVKAIFENSRNKKRTLAETTLELENNLRYLAVMAIYEPTIPKEDYKATVNWINAEGKIPESFVLKLMNGSSVVKEQVITKDNAVDEDTWEYDFGEYPTLDDNGNEITYTLAYSEGKDGDLKFFESNQDGFVINNTYIAPEISSKVKMRSLADREKNNVKYRIDYTASIKKYSGNAEVVLTTTLPFAIDEAKSDLDDGTYDAKTRSITWTETIKDIDKVYDYSTTKNIDLYATAVLPYAIEAKTVGEVTLSDAEGFSESVDAIDNIEAGTGNPKTGDINLQKYLSIGLIGIATILMVVSIRRKYSTRKSKVQF